MPAQALDDFLVTAVQPFLQAHGYRKRRRTFRWHDSSCDYSVIEFSTMPGYPRWPCFVVEYGYIVYKSRPYLPAELQTHVALDPPAYKGQLRFGIQPPLECQYDHPLGLQSAWALPDPAERAPVTTALLDIIRDQLFPVVERVVDGERSGYELTGPNLMTLAVIAPFELPGSQLHTSIYGDDDWLGGGHASDVEPAP